VRQSEVHWLQLDQSACGVKLTTPGARIHAKAVEVSSAHDRRKLLSADEAGAAPQAEFPTATRKPGQEEKLAGWLVVRYGADWDESRHPACRGDTLCRKAFSP
jgi:hypothetical protein